MCVSVVLKRFHTFVDFLDEFTIKTVEQLSLAFPVVTRDYGRFAVLKKISQPMGKILNGEKLWEILVVG